MGILNLTQINIYAPYSVWEDGNEYLFKTEHDILYSIIFDQETIILNGQAYWFNLYNRSWKNSPNDHKIQETINYIIEDFFNNNPNVLLYMCDTADEKQEIRSRLFLRWYNNYKHKERFIFKAVEFEDEGIKNYISLIVAKANNNIEEILSIFNYEVKMFQENK